MDACRLEDWFANELFEVIAERRIREVENRWKQKKNTRCTSTGQIQKNDETQKERWKYKYGKKRTTTRAACDENPICHAELRSFIGYESFKRPSAPQAKVNAHRGETATRHRYAENYCLASLSLNMKAWLKRLYVCLFFAFHWWVWTQFFVDRQQQATASIINRFAVKWGDIFFLVLFIQGINKTKVALRSGLYVAGISSVDSLERKAWKMLN